jgi:hypothetical protein
MKFESGAREASVLVSNLNSFVLDYVARMKVGGSHLSSFILRQLPILPLAAFRQPLEWLGSDAVSWISPRAAELIYTAVDLGSFGSELNLNHPPFVWRPQRREFIRAELDALFFHLYDLERAEVDYVMDTFPIVTRKDDARHGEHRTKRLILEVYDAMQEAMDAGKPYETRLDPPPGDPRAAHPSAGPGSH